MLFTYVLKIYLIPASLQLNMLSGVGGNVSMENKVAVRIYVFFERSA
jgi:hypothetical protein